jgi:predicted PurR-regulated permease PerM
MYDRLKIPGMNNGFTEVVEKQQTKEVFNFILSLLLFSLLFIYLLLFLLLLLLFYFHGERKEEKKKRVLLLAVEKKGGKRIREEKGYIEKKGVKDETSLVEEKERMIREE